MPKFDPEAARAHLIRLAEDRGVTVEWVDSWEVAESWPPGLAVAIPEIRTARDYLIGLHEFGHVLSPHARGLYLAGVLYDEITCEAYAWAWAATHTDTEIAATISAAEWDKAMRAFSSYLRFAATCDSGWPRYLPLEAGGPGHQALEI